SVTSAVAGVSFGAGFSSGTFTAVFVSTVSVFAGSAFAGVSAATDSAAALTSSFLSAATGSVAAGAVCVVCAAGACVAAVTFFLRVFFLLVLVRFIVISLFESDIYVNYQMLSIILLYPGGFFQRRPAIYFHHPQYISTVSRYVSYHSAIY